MLFAGGSMTPVLVYLLKRVVCIWPTANGLRLYEHERLRLFNRTCRNLPTIGKPHNPDIVCINDTRFIAESCWAPIIL